MLGQLVAQFRLWLALALCCGIVVIDSASRVISMLADLGLVAVLIAVLWPSLKGSTRPEKQV